MNLDEKDYNLIKNSILSELRDSSILNPNNGRYKTLIYIF